MSRKPFEPAKMKFNPTSNLDSKKRTYTAIGLAMLLTFVSVMVYMVSSLDEDAILNQDEVDVELNEWHTYYVESESELPECGDDTIGRLYYIESSEKFEACTPNGWITVDIKGADGAPGQDGSDGAPGQDGQDGVDGVPGQDGSDGAPGQDGQDGEDGQDVDPAQLQEIQDDLLELNNATGCQLVPYGNCAGADLSHMNLTGMDLTGINLRGANLQNTTLDFATLDGADLRSIVAMNASFIHTGMNRTYLQNAEFNRYDFSECGGFCGSANLTNAYLDYANLAYAYFAYANLTDANLIYSDLTGVYLIYSDLTDANPGGSDLTDANLM